MKENLTDGDFILGANLELLKSDGGNLLIKDQNKLVR